MSEEEEWIPVVPFGLDELRGLERILWGYSQYLRRAPGVAQQTSRIHALESMRKRLDAHLRGGDFQDIQMFLDVEEVGLLLDALEQFRALVERLFPRTGGRDSVIEAVETWHRRLVTLMSEPETP